MANPKGKKKFLLWIYPSTQELVKNNYRKDHCKSQSEFIERAIQYYIFFGSQLKRQEMPPTTKDEGKKEYKKVRKSLVTSGFS